MVSVSMKTISSYLNIFIHVLDFSNWRINSTKAESVCKSHNARVLEIELRWLYFLIKNLMLTAIEDFLQYCQTWIRHPPGFHGSCPNEDGDNESPPKGLPGFSNLLLSHFNLWSTGWRQRLGTRSWIQKATYAAYWWQFADSASLTMGKEALGILWGWSQDKAHSRLCLIPSLLALCRLLLTEKERAREQGSSGKSIFPQEFWEWSLLTSLGEAPEK